MLKALKSQGIAGGCNDYFVELEDPLENLEYYQKGMIVRVPTPWGVQGFRCDNPSIQNNRITCKAWHLTYDARNYLIEDAYAVNKNCNDALNHFNDATDVPSPFTVLSDITTTLSTRAIRVSLYDIFEKLIGTDKYGGHWVRDNYNFAIRQAIGQDRGVTLAYRKNITDIEISENWDDVCTKLLPYTTGDSITIQLDETYVELNEELYDIPYSKTLKFENPYAIEDFASEEEFIATSKAWLLQEAHKYLDEHKFPQINYSVSASINNVSDVGDLIYVKHPKCKVDITTNVIAVRYDAIKRRYTKIEFGNFKKEIKNFKREIATEIGKETDKKIDETKALLEEELNKATAQINSALGSSYVINNGNEILIVDRLPKEEAVYCIKANSAGIGFSSTGINGTFNSAWTIDGTLNMQNINVINLTASLIKGGTLKLGGVNNASGTFELYDEASTLIGLMNKDGLKMFGEDGSYVLLNNDVGFAGFDKSNNKIYWVDQDEFHQKKSVVEEEITLCNKVRFIPITITDDNGNIVNDGIGLVPTI